MLLINDYTQQAIVWDWDGYDNTPEYDYWCDYAARFGKNVLIPMCAHGQTGAYMAGKGFQVTAFDIAPEMITEGNKRYGAVNDLKLAVADLLSLNLDKKDFDFTFIAGNGDLHLLQNIEDVEKALRSLHRHLRGGGCLALELTLPGRESWQSPPRVFHPRKPNYADKRVWKESESRYDALEKRHYIHQIIYIEDGGGVGHFDHDVRLQYYERKDMLAFLRACGFCVQNEYCNREREPWKHGDSLWIVEAIKGG